MRVPCPSRAGATDEAAASGARVRLVQHIPADLDVQRIEGAVVQQRRCVVQHRPGSPVVVDRLVVRGLQHLQRSRGGSRAEAVNTVVGEVEPVHAVRSRIACNDRQEVKDAGKILELVALDRQPMRSEGRRARPKGLGEIDLVGAYAAGRASQLTQHNRAWEDTCSHHRGARVDQRGAGDCRSQCRAGD